jgi:hypothetical protein
MATPVTGVVAEDGVARHGRGCGEIALAVGTVLDDLAVASEDGDGADEVLLIDFILDEFVEVLQALRGEADRLWIDGREVERAMSRGRWCCGRRRLGLLRVGVVEAES